MFSYTYIQSFNTSFTLLQVSLYVSSSGRQVVIRDVGKNMDAA